MVVCRYYQTPAGCRYGKNCKYEHIDPPGSGGGGGGGGVGSGSNDPFSSPTKSQGRHNTSKPNEDHLQWPLSAIAINESAEQGNALEGEWSPEELRVQAYQIAPRGMSADVTQREGQLVAEHQAKVDALSRGGMQTPSSNGGDGFQAKDPFAQGGTSFAQGGPSSSQPGQGFNGFGGLNGGAQQQQPFGLPTSQMAQGAAPPQGNNMFSQNHTYNNQPQAPVQNPAPIANASHDPQFSATQFGFASVPESTPPPKYY